MRKKAPLGRRIYRVFVVVIFIYCSIGIALYYLQDKFFLHPKSLLPSYQYSFDVPFKEINIAMNKRTNLNMVQFFVPGKEPKGVVLYFHGNSGNINNYAAHAAEFTNRGYEVWMPDYPGFGKSTGDFDEKLVYNEAREIYKLAKSQFGVDSIVFYGRSLGSAPASYLAAKLPGKMLILESPFYDVPSVFKYYAPIYPVERMANYKFPTGFQVWAAKIPVAIFSGKKDKIIPYKNAGRLKSRLKERDEFVTIEEGGHNNLSKFKEYQTAMDKLLR